ncbi:MAG TPA: hypothetical protein VOA87_04200 [Thermoanaerobaculia bacterium]|nr:hypothetical protein [Thermoanaerobaculia bacterium]
MNRRHAQPIEVLALALMVAASLAFPARGFAADLSIAHIDGNLTDEGSRCQALRDHDGKLYSLVGAIDGLQTSDHVRLEGRFVNDSGCRQGTAFQVSLVQTLWADQNHRSTYYDHLHDGSFDQFAARNGRPPVNRYNRRRYGDRDNYRGPGR